MAAATFIPTTGVYGGTALIVQPARRESGIRLGLRVSLRLAGLRKRPADNGFD
jgi:hypothetical protein